MGDANERYELQQRISRLPAEDRLLLIESVLADLRRQHFEDQEAIRQEIQATEARYAAQRGARLLTGEAKREAG